jgi:uncharacterized membrane protein YgaE (UPF0421/DUF939 family)
VVRLGLRAGNLTAAIASSKQRVRSEAIFAVQSGIAAGLAWFLAADVLHHGRPFFAPIASVIVLSAGVGLRFLRAFELAGGVALGILVGNAVILAIGVGPIQIAVVVTLAIMAIAAFGGGGVAVGQAAASAVLATTLAPPTNGITWDRLFDALIGGSTALVVLVLLPFNPLTRVKRAAEQALSLLTDSLNSAARSIGHGDPALADAALTTLREHESDPEALRDAVTIGRETATVAPLRWGSRAALSQYANAAVYIDRATRSARVIESRVAALLRDGEAAPVTLAESLTVLADGVKALRKDLANGRDPAKARGLTLDAVRAAASAGGLGMSGLVVVSQVDSAAANLLCAAGMNKDDAQRSIRRASAEPGSS